MSEHDADAVVERIAKVMGQGWGAVIDTLALLKPGDDLGNGLVAVPREPTQEMLIMALQAFLEMQPPMAPVEDGQELSESESAQRYMELGSRIRTGKEMAAIYRAMLAAAAEPATRGSTRDDTA